MPFRGWPVEAIEFYEALEGDNSKAYWQANKAVYQQAVQAPMQALLAELAPDFGEGRIFRPFRDVRFSADKSPYKTNCAATIASGGYLSLSANGLGAGTGMYMMAADQLDRYRRAVTDDATGEQLVSLVKAVTKQGIEVTAHESLKTAPKGYPRDHPRIDLLRLKGLITWREWPVGAWLGTAQAKKRVIAFFRASEPINDWLQRNVGASELPPERS